MKKPILWIDEDKHFWADERGLLNAFGYEVKAIPNATEAVDFFGSVDSCDDVQLIILDVMMLPGPAFKASEPGVIKTGNDIGLILANKIHSLDEGFGKKILFFSCAEDPLHIKRIENAANVIKGKYAAKDSKNQDLGFVDLLINMGFINPNTD